MHVGVCHLYCTCVHMHTPINTNASLPTPPPFYLLRSGWVELHVYVMLHKVMCIYKVQELDELRLHTVVASHTGQDVCILMPLGVFF